MLRQHLEKTLWIAIFFSNWVFFNDHSQITGLQGKGKGIFLSSSLSLPPASQTLTVITGDYCRELTSAHR